ncbi:hypothetical protein [Trichocoleus sp. FACHB-262]|nr:hypothetical protein [Trichocoleus sp. FACHB-262]
MWRGFGLFQTAIALNPINLSPKASEMIKRRSRHSRLPLSLL